MQEVAGSLLVILGCVLFAVMLTVICKPVSFCRRILRRMRERNDRRPMLAVAFLISVFTIGLAGCTRHHVIFVEPGIPVRLKERIPGVLVFVKTKDGTFVEARTDLPAGYWVTTLPEEWDTDARVDQMNLVREDAPEPEGEE